MRWGVGEEHRMNGRAVESVEIESLDVMEWIRYDFILLSEESASTSQIVEIVAYTFINSGSWYRV